MADRMLILGGRESGTGAALLAAAKGYNVLLSDAGTILPQYKEKLTAAGITCEEQSHDRAAAFDPELIVKSPGIPDTAPLVAGFLEAGVPVLSEIEFAARHSKAVIVGITGSNGKTTTTALTGHLLRQGGLDAVVAGNIGNSFAEVVLERDPAYAVLEVSSFQLDNIQTFRPHIAVLLNITPDHLDRYGYSMDRYAAAKLRIGENQTASDYFLYCADDPETSTRVAASSLAGQRIPFALNGPLDQGAWVEDNQLHVNLRINNQQNNFSMSIYELALQGKHNIYNSMAASIAARVLEVRKDAIRESLMDFRALEHRLETVVSVHGVAFINDSKATNVNSTWYALESMDKPVIWIAGGVDKGNDYSQLTDLVRQKVKAVICLGKDNRKLHEAFSRSVDLMVNTQSMVEAVRMAYHLSNPGDAVLLSPACASFDLFRNYEDRGWQFKMAVKAL
jgi:UDP-N-acetylmuramoylalanine--D-glutamate ligase